VANWTLAEFLFELEHDATRKVLFVEGLRDLSFWRNLVPSTVRGDTVIYPISVIQFESAEGGERGRMFCIASAVLASRMSVRVLFFADADYDRIFAREPHSNVVLTDSRDLESYGITARCIENLCVRGIAMDEVAATPLFGQVISVARPIGTLRVASERANMKLPFQRTLERRGLSRFISLNEGGAQLDMDRLVSTMLQNAGISLAQLSEILGLQRNEEKSLAVLEHDQVVHGKDFVRTLACILRLDEDQIERLLFLSMDISEIALRPNIARVQTWIRPCENPATGDSGAA